MSSSSILDTVIDKGYIQDRILYMPGLSKQEVKEVNRKLREDLLNYNIYHSKIVGVVVRESVGSVRKNAHMLMPTGCGLSYIQICAKLKDFILPYNTTNGVILMGKVNTDGTGITEVNSDSNLPTLVKNEELLDLTNVDLVMAKVKGGTGLYDFKNSQWYLRKTANNQKGIVYRPMRVEYDLTDYFMIKPFSAIENTIEFLYKKDINEEVLWNLLKQHFIKTKEGKNFEYTSNIKG